MLCFYFNLHLQTKKIFYKSRIYFHFTFMYRKLDACNISIQLSLILFYFFEIYNFSVSLTPNLQILQIKINELTIVQRFSQIMKSVRNKKISNSSFLSNHDLLENFRNKSFKLITRQASLSELKQVPKKVSLIQKKNYEEKNKQNKENDQLLSNRKIINVSKGQTQRQKHIQEISVQNQIQKVIKELNYIYDQINVDEIQLKMVLNKNIRKIKEIFRSKAQNAPQKNNEQTQKQTKEKVEFLNIKVQDQAKKIFKYKKECDSLHDKVNLYERQITQLQKKLSDRKKMYDQLKHNSKNPRDLNGNCFQLQTQQPHHTIVETHQHQNQLKDRRQNKIQILHNIIETQQELIGKQMSDFQAQNQEFLRILQIQALKIQDLISDKNTIPQQHSPKCFINDQKSTAIQSKYDSNTSYRGTSVNNFSSYNSPLRTQDLIAKINRKNVKPGDFSICLY